MNGATSLALARRLRDHRYAEEWFVGRGIDIGCGPDPLAGHTWPHAQIRNWDLPDGDATVLPGIEPESFDFVYSSHCLEHLHAPATALRRWWEVLRPGGYLIVVVPDFAMYERGQWPSRQDGHLSRWTLDRLEFELLVATHGRGQIIACHELADRFDPDLPVTVDQTTKPYNAECGIEAVVRKCE